jgi:hypothetical protein
MELPRGPAHIRRREALPAAMEPDLVAAGGAALGRLRSVGRAAEGAQESALLTDCIDRRFHL